MTMANHLLHIDSSIQGDRSVSRRLTARAAGVWLAAHPGGTVTTATWAPIRCRISIPTVASPGWSRPRSTRPLRPPRGR